MLAATLFSGIGAAEAAMPHWCWKWCAEVEPFASAVLSVHHPHTVNLGDVTADGFAQRAGAIAAPDVLVFGSPCQSFSVAGRRLGLDDPRGNLALVALRIVGQLRPSWFVFENVPGLLSIDDGRGFGLFLRAVDELGYFGAWASLDAQYFGVAQRRNRLFFVGHSGDWRYPAAVLFEPKSLCGHSAPRQQARQEIASGLGAGSKRSGGRIGRREAAGNQLIAGTLGTRSAAHPDGTKHEADFMVFGGNNTAGPIDLASACRAKGGTGHGDFESETFVLADPISANEGRTYSHEGAHNFRLHNVVNGSNGGAIAFDTTQITHPENRCQPQAGDPCHPIPAHGHAPALATASAVRRLMPTECERLQGFSDNYTLVKYRGKPAADGPRYRALGNAMAVPVMRWLLTRIEQMDKV